MIDRTHRFQGHGSLRFVYQRGKVIRGPFSALKYIRNSRRHTYRVAVVVSRKVHKSAVIRNRIRRRVYEIIRQATSATTSPYDIVYIMYTDQVARMPHDELHEAIVLQLEKAGIVPGEYSRDAPHAIVKPKE